MSQRLWENPPYKDETAEKLLAKIQKCYRHKRYREAAIASTDLAAELESLHLAEGAARAIEGAR